VIVGPGNKEENYELREMLARDRDRYLDQLGTRVVMDSEGKVIRIQKFDGLQASLLACCLFDSEGRSVGADKIQSWPAGTVAALFEAAQQLNLLNASGSATNPEKNE
jgi:hypothetical protein